MMNNKRLSLIHHSSFIVPHCPSAPEAQNLEVSSERE
jgi:hypothetical protein